MERSGQFGPALHPRGERTGIGGDFAFYEFELPGLFPLEPILGCLRKVKQGSREAVG